MNNNKKILRRFSADIIENETLAVSQFHNNNTKILNLNTSLSKFLYFIQCSLRIILNYCDFFLLYRLYVEK